MYNPTSSTPLSATGLVFDHLTLGKFRAAVVLSRPCSGWNPLTLSGPDFNISEVSSPNPHSVFEHSCYVAVYVHEDCPSSDPIGFASQQVELESWEP